MRHVTVFSEPGIYAGWPANHGAWQWGDELLVGFITGQYYPQSHPHPVAGVLSFRQARSIDGGDTWETEETNIPEKMPPHSGVCPHLDLTEDIIRVRGAYDHGGDFINGEGGFYASCDKGKSWNGPFSLDGVDFTKHGLINTSRTRTIGNTVFLSARRPDQWGSDFIIVARNDEGRFVPIGYVRGSGRVVMPAAAALNGRTFVTARRRSGESPVGWIDCYRSSDFCTWHMMSRVGETGVNNGNPPALITHNGSLVCAYADRSGKHIIAKVSDDGIAWSAPIILRSGECSDIGYPQLFATENGLVCVYYWSDNDHETRRIEATIFEA